MQEEIIEEYKKAIKLEPDKGVTIGFWLMCMLR